MVEPAKNGMRNDSTVLQLPASGTPEGAKDEVEAEPKRQRVIV